MKLHSEDPQLTAYALGELGPHEATTVGNAAAEDPALQAKIREITETQRFLTDNLAVTTDSLLPHQRENIRCRAREADRTAKTITLASLRDTLQPWLIPASAAAVLAMTTFMLIRMPADPPSPVATKTLAPVPATPPPTVPASKPVEQPISAPLVRHGSVAAADFPTLELPVQSTTSSLGSISKFIRNDRQLPPHQAVRLEEVLNGFSFRLNGATSIARGGANSWHPDKRNSGMSSHLATLTTETIACPWKPSATLLLVSLRGNAQKDCDVKITYHADPENVLRYRLLGFPPDTGKTTENLPTKLAANSMTTLAIEIEPSRPGNGLGTLDWSVDDKAAPPISLIHKNDAEPSDDARFAALVCTYAQWLGGEQAGIIAPDIVAALAREIASATLPADRADFLNLIDCSLQL